MGNKDTGRSELEAETVGAREGLRRKMKGSMRGVWEEEIKLVQV